MMINIWKINNKSVNRRHCKYTIQQSIQKWINRDYNKSSQPVLGKIDRST